MIPNDLRRYWPAKASSTTLIRISSVPGALMPPAKNRGTLSTRPDAADVASSPKPSVGSDERSVVTISVFLSAAILTDALRVIGTRTPAASGSSARPSGTRTPAASGSSVRAKAVVRIRKWRSLSQAWQGYACVLPDGMVLAATRRRRAAQLDLSPIYDQR